MEEKKSMTVTFVKTTETNVREREKEILYRETEIRKVERRSEIEREGEIL